MRRRRTMTTKPPPRQRRWSWRSQALRGVLFQLLAVALLLAAGAYLLHNTLANMRARGIQSGFDFITQPAGFAIGESIVPFDAADSYGKAYLVGLSNTLRVALAGIVAATLLGTLIGHRAPVAQPAGALAVRRLCRVAAQHPAAAAVVHLVLPADRIVAADRDRAAAAARRCSSARTACSFRCRCGPAGTGPRWPAWLAAPPRYGAGDASRASASRPPARPGRCSGRPWR